jgi:hypothetical protein
MRFLAAAILAGHAIVHGVMWALPYSEAARSDLPMDPSHSWLIGDARGLGLGLALAATAAFLVVAGAVLADASWWAPAAIVASALSGLLLGLFFSPWWLVGAAIDAAIVAVAWRSLG